VDGGLAEQRIALRSLDIASIAAGGGSIGSIDAGGTFRVGPESAGSVPGPACYGNGGTAATVTDANVILGYLDAAAFLGGQRPLDRTAAEAAVDRLATSLDLSRQETAAGIYRMINLKMADGIRLMTLRRGVDPRRFALLSFGGAAGLHAAEVARELDIKRIIVPTAASVLSAWGMLTSDLRYEVSRTHFGADLRISPEEVRTIFNELEQQATGRLNAWFGGPIAVERSAEMRYGEQIFEIDVSLLDRRPDRGSLSSPPRRALHLCVARSGGGVRQCARRGRRRSAARRSNRQDRVIRCVLPSRHDAQGVLWRMARRAGLFDRIAVAGPFLRRPRYRGSRDHNRRRQQGGSYHRQRSGLA
jgi:N-methylhydantoinase A/oxoprolinase/acetone carboxylase beta subunit